MVKISADVHPVSALRRRARERIGQTRRTGRPVLITQRGRCAAVMVSVEEWERREERTALLEAILRGERDFVEGRVVGEDEVLARTRAAARPTDRH